MLGSDSPGTKSATNTQSLHLSTELSLSLEATSRCQN